MKPLIPLALIAAAVFVSAAPGHADCFVDYKAKQDDPLKLHYGVAQIADPDCVSTEAAARALAPRLEKGGWTLLTILSIFDDTGLEGKQVSAGKFYLSF